MTRWWTSCPRANIGVVTGRASGLVVLDVDVRSGGDASLAALVERHGHLPETPTVLTGGGGLHYYFAHPGDVIRNSAGKLGAGLDIRGDGGYIVAPPSLHASGQTYTWAVAGALAPMPSWLRVTVSSRGSRSIDTAAALAGVAEGERDEALFGLACKLRRADVPRAFAEDLVVRAAKACTPPFPVEEARKKVTSVYERYLPGPEPRRARTKRHGLRSVS